MRNMEKILIVVDMQNDFIDGSLGTKEAELIVPSVIEKIKNWDGEVLFTMDTHFDNYLETQEGKNLPVKHCIEKTNGWEIKESVLDAAYSQLVALNIDCFTNPIAIYQKNTFASEDLVNDIKRFTPLKSLKEIHLIGLCTDICVVSNALLIKAKFPEVKIVVDSNCCAGVTPEKHNAALDVMRSCQIEII